MKKIAYIIPGFGHSPHKQRGYKTIGRFFVEQGITPRYIRIQWNDKKPRRFADFVDQFSRQYKKDVDSVKIVLGFSYGATIAFLSASKLKPDVLILCSLSPYFVEDLGHLPLVWRKWWEKNFVESDYSFKKLAPTVRGKTVLVHGGKEGREVSFRVRDAHRRIRKSTLKMVKGARHQIYNKAYQETVRKIIATL